ncbi:MAG: recombination regulator RecX [Rhodocyclales bacterium RIFCSPLOWO2_02_FULL_63_24]|nr:MAG: recombination regulator RecX [Rhodocyclales bacterium GWA2_65_19]OHC68516.1 MAG: recombination regulator RecX [Rhodocyclales bacterium RIFCSPLOWO2_02_FULL_63_24]
MSNDLRQQAIRLLARREHTRAELVRKLAALGTREEIDSVITELQASNLQSDSRAAESYVRSHGARLGASRLRQDLKTRGVVDELIDAQLDRDVLPDEMERARVVWARKFSAAPSDARDWARQARFLQGRGFASDVIRRLLKEPMGTTEE